MPLRWRATAAALVCAVHLAVFVPTIGDWSSVLVNDFAPQAQAIKGGDLPYRDQRIEYPPLSVPVLIAPIYGGTAPRTSSTDSSGRCSPSTSASSS